MKKNKNGPKPDYLNTFLIGFGFLASSLAWSLYNSFVPMILEDRFLKETTLIGFIMTIDNFFGIINQPIVGVLSDKTNTRYGKRMPWIFIGLPLCAVLFFFIPRMPSLALTMAVIIAFNLIMSLWRSPVIALMPDVTAAPLRSSANGIINLMGGIGSVIAFLVGGKLADLSGGRTLPFAMGSVVMLISLVLLYLFVREPAGLRYRVLKGDTLSRREKILLERYDRDVPESEQEKQDDQKAKGLFGKKVHGYKNLTPAEKVSLCALLFAIFFWFAGYNAVETFFTLYAKNNLGVTEGKATMLLTAFSLTFLAFAVPSGFLAQKIGRRRMIMIGLIGLIAVFLPMLFIQNASVVLVLLLIGGIFWASININSLPMVVEMATGESIGSFTGYYYFFSFAASIASPILFGFIRDLTEDYASLFPYAIAAFAAALVCILFVKHGESKPQAEGAPKEARTALGE